MASDRKRWVKQPTSILRKGWSNDELAAVVRLSCWLGDRWARDGLGWDKAGRAEMSAVTAMAITGKRRADVALKSLQHLADISEISVELRGDIAAIDWPNWSAEQRGASRSPGGDYPQPAPSKTQTQTQKKEDPPTPRNGGSAPAPRSQREVPKEVIGLAVALGGAVRRSMPGQQLPKKLKDVYRWAQEIDRLIRLDGAEPEQIKELIHWLPRHERGDFRWGLVIRSARKLRQHWGPLLAEMQRTGEAGEEARFQRVMQHVRGEASERL